MYKYIEVTSAAEPSRQGVKKQPCNRLLTGKKTLCKASDVLSRQKPPDLLASQLIVARWEYAGAADGRSRLEPSGLAVVIPKAQDCVQCQRLAR